ncbi:hypothetical protein FEDK69T_19190 [Flavobacterium enshiense DK69]|nr:hypothetical protein FEDK69T_19190 [Flavobacterium enshiense DK69]
MACSQFAKKFFLSHDKKYDVKRNIAEDYSFAKKIVNVKK